MRLSQRSFSLVPSPEDKRDLKLGSFGIEPPEEVTDHIELELPPWVYDQGRTDMCTAFALAQMASILNGNVLEFSPTYAYANKGTPGEGGFLRTVIAVLYRKGIATMGALPLVKGSYADCQFTYEQHKAVADAFAPLGRIRYYAKVEDAQEAFAALKLGRPILAGLMVRSNFVPDQAGHIPKPSGDSLGGHAVLIVGAKPGYYKILNSWGDQWGLKGTAWIPNEWIFEMWTGIDAKLTPDEIMFRKGDKNVYTNRGRFKMDTEPYFDENGRMQIPIRTFEHLDFTVTYNHERGEALLKR